ncbi:MAG: BolA/IbaG family iron-sulfur metabolism protein [Pseudohongiellaceae bacterium]
MSVQQTIEAKLAQGLQPLVLEVANESHMHGGPATESHFNITAVATAFEDMNLVRRHQAVYKLLAEELAAGVHALALHLYTGAEWELRQESSPSSPDCRGGSKSDQAHQANIDQIQ